MEGGFTFFIFRREGDTFSLEECVVEFCEEKFLCAVGVSFGVTAGADKV